MKKVNGNLFSVIVRGILDCGAKTVALAAFTAFATSAFAANENTTGMRGVEDLQGLSVEQITAAETDDGKFPAEMDKQLFLYNVKSGRFLNVGGYWGTHISLKDYGMPLWVKKTDNTNTFRFEQEMSTDVGHYLSYFKQDDTEGDYGVFVDRLKEDNYGWVFEPVTGDSQNTFKIYTYADANGNGNGAKLYLYANKDEVDVDKNCEAATKDRITAAGADGYDTWRVFTYQQIFNLQDDNTDNMTSSLELSFKLQCPGFSRGNQAIKNWKTKTFSDKALSGYMVRYGLENIYNKDSRWNNEQYDVNKFSNNSSFSYEFNGKAYKTDKDYRRDLAKYFCVDARNVHGIIYQDVPVKHTGSYIIECKGYSTTPKAVLFAGLVDPKDSTQLLASSMHKTVLSQTSYMSDEEKAKLHISEKNMDYAGKEFYGSRKYINSVLVQVPDNSESKIIRLGIMIGDYNLTDTPEDGEWTVFDDFRMLYASRTTDEDLVLDQDRDNLEYLTESSNTYKNKILHLHKEFEKDKWNSFILPVSLTRDQFTQAFGANARLAKLSEMTDNEIRFETVKVAAANSTDIVFKAFTPYIICPTKDLKNEQSPAYTALLTKTGQSTKTERVVIASGHIDIPNVTFDTDAELKNIDQGTWTTKCTYSDSQNKLTAYGTFARTFGQSSEQDFASTDSRYGTFKLNDKNIIDGRDNLIGSYFFSGGKLCYSNQRVRGLRGFSCWFKEESANPSGSMLMTLDGISQGTANGIGSVIATGEEPAVNRFAGNVYNMNGQIVRHGNSTEGLPSGMYIVNGRKCVVK